MLPGPAGSLPNRQRFGSGIVAEGLLPIPASQGSGLVFDPEDVTDGRDSMVVTPALGVQTREEPRVNSFTSEASPGDSPATGPSSRDRRMRTLRENVPGSDGLN